VLADMQRENNEARWRLVNQTLMFSQKLQSFLRGERSRKRVAWPVPLQCPAQRRDRSALPAREGALHETWSSRFGLSASSGRHLTGGQTHPVARWTSRARMGRICPKKRRSVRQAFR